MPNGDSPSQDLKTKIRAVIPPGITFVCSVLWQILGVAQGFAFILQIQDRTFRGLLFQGFVRYGWLALAGFSVIWGVWAFRKKARPEEVGFKATWGMVIAAGLVAFLYGVFITVRVTGSIPDVMGDWSPTSTGCRITVDTSRMETFKKKYNLVGLCGWNDSATDKLQQTGITISRPFEITGEWVAIFAQFSPEMATEVSQGIVPASVVVAGPPSGAVGSRFGPGYLWYLPALLPKDADLSKIMTLSDVRKQGGKILSHTYYE